MRNEKLWNVTDFGDLNSNTEWAVLEKKLQGEGASGARLLKTFHCYGKTGGGELKPAIGGRLMRFSVYAAHDHILNELRMNLDFS